jgi:hypothetical protein
MKFTNQGSAKKRLFCGAMESKLAQGIKHAKNCKCCTFTYDLTQSLCIGSSLDSYVSWIQNTIVDVQKAIFTSEENVPSIDSILSSFEDIGPSQLYGDGAYISDAESCNSGDASSPDADNNNSDDHESGMDEEPSRQKPKEPSRQNPTFYSTISKSFNTNLQNMKTQIKGSVANIPAGMVSEERIALIQIIVATYITHRLIQMMTLISDGYTSCSQNQATIILHNLLIHKIPTKNETFGTFDLLSHVCQSYCCLLLSRDVPSKKKDDYTKYDNYALLHTLHKLNTESKKQSCELALNVKPLSKKKRTMLAATLLMVR